VSKVLKESVVAMAFRKRKSVSPDECNCPCCRSFNKVAPVKPHRLEDNTEFTTGI
jgi:hypothetical protein